jgi:hypothetical protein
MKPGEARGQTSDVRRQDGPQGCRGYNLTAIILLSVALLSSCTIAPKPIKATQASFSGNVQNSGMIAAPKQDELGFAVNQDYIDAYDALLAKFGSGLFPPRKPGDRNGIVKEGDHYRVTDAVVERYLVMNQQRMAAEHGP